MSPASFTSPLAEALAEDLLERFLRYVQVDTQARRNRTGSPSSPGQLELGRLVAAELREAGLLDAALDANGYVMATLPATELEGARRAPVVGLIAHLDTSPDAPGAGVQPIVHRAYGGGIIELPRSGTRLDPASMPELATKVGHDIVTASGDTLLGADDKVGVAAITTAVAYLAAHPELPRPTLRVAFTPDEEIGEGATLFDIERFGALCAYTIDGSEVGELQDETFTAAQAILTIDGVDVHPGQATGKLVSALKLAARIVDALPTDRLSPETTSGREGFIHPYEMTGTPARATISTIVRDFDDDELERHLEFLRRTAEDVIAAEPRATLQIDVKHQYPNMRSFIEPVRSAIRGGTDGSKLSARGLPTPNIFTGGHEYHSVREWASLQDMAAAAATIVHLAEVWTRPELAGAGPASQPAPE